MSSRIKTYADLCEERERMVKLLALQKERITKDWAELKDEFHPITNAFGLFGKMAKGDHSYPFLNTGLSIASDIFLKNFVLGKAGWLTRLAVPYVMKNYSSHLIVEKGQTFLAKLSKIFQKKKPSVPHVPTHDEKPILSPSNQSL